MDTAITRPHTQPQRILKALTLADTLDAAGIPSADAEMMNGGEWRMLADAARTRVPSLRTRELVINFLRRREAARLQFDLNRSLPPRIWPWGTSADAGMPDGGKQ